MSATLLINGLAVLSALGLLGWCLVAGGCDVDDDGEWW